MTSTPQKVEPAAERRAPKSAAAVARFLMLAVLVLAGDLALKWYAFAHVAGTPIDGEALREFGDHAIPPHEGVNIIPSVLELKLTVNHGAVFGIGQGGRWVFVAIAFIACAVIARIFWVSRARDWKLHAALAFVTGGAIGNLYDRFSYGMVRDMLFAFPDVNLPFGWNWPDGSTLVYPWIFNLADAALLVGIVAIVIGMLFGGQARSERTKT
jgi:signal peptidase II